MVGFRADGDGRCPAGKDEMTAAVKAARCPHFVEDVEEELVADEAVSCLNCRYRRWTETSYDCMHPAYGNAG